jgi:hypothetical protein
MKIKLPSLRNLVTDAHRSGAVANRFRVTPDEATRIRRAERRGGHQAGLAEVLLILREKNQARR